MMGGYSGGGAYAVGCDDPDIKCEAESVILNSSCFFTYFS